MTQPPALTLPADRPLLILELQGVIGVFQCAEGRRVQGALHVPTLQLLPDLQDWLGQLSRAFQLAWYCKPDALAQLSAALPGLPPHQAIIPSAEELLADDAKLQAISRSLNDWAGALAWVGERFSSAQRAWATSRLRRGAPTWLVDITEQGLSPATTAGLLDWGSMMAG